MGAKGGTMSFRSMLVALALVAFTTFTGCANGGQDATSKAYCESVLFTSPSCITNTPSPAGTSLTVPTGEIRPKMEGDPSRDFVAVVELVSLSPSPNVVQNGTFRFSPSIRFRVDNLGIRGGNSVNYSLYTSNDGVNKISEFGNGYIYTYVDDYFGTNGMFMMMPPFKYILVEMKTTINGQGELWAQPIKFEVGYTR